MRKFIALNILGFTMLSSCAQEPALVNVQSLPASEIYLKLFEGKVTWDPKVEKKLSAEWSVAHAPFLLETKRFTQNSLLSQRLNRLLEEKSGVKIPSLNNRGQKWLWSQTYEEDPSYADFKSDLYEKIDKRFSSYFDSSRKSTIRLDEVVWGGVVQDGIPPLRNPKMISAKQADYLGDDDIVFGIDVDGDQRAYPKRILAWHEMFTDTIKGIPLAGVY